MSYTYANRKRTEQSAPQRETAPAQPELDALRAGTARPTAEQMGRRVDLPDAMRSKMESAFGADLSAVKLYESETVADAGAEAVARGSDIAFAPGMLDFSSYGGQALLGHEISHVVSQARGEVAQSGGFLNDHALEARADREGAMAAAGQQIAAPTAAMSAVSAAPAAGPMQASKKQRRAQRQLDSYEQDNHVKAQNFEAAIGRYNASRGDLPEFVMHQGDVRTQRFLSRHMTGTDEENDALFRNVMQNGVAGMLPALSTEARRINSFDLDAMDTDKGVLSKGGELLALHKDSQNLMDLIKDGLVDAASLGMSDEDFARLKQNNSKSAMKSLMTTRRLRALAGQKSWYD